MLRGIAAIFLILGLVAAPLTLAGPSARPIPAISRVLLVSVDGLRPDCLLRAPAPAIRSLMDHGAFSMWAQTTAVAVTLPSHVSMLTGVPPAKHGIVWNRTLPLKPPVYPAWPTLFELARHAGYTTAMAAGKPKFATLAKPRTLSWAFVPDSTIVPDSVVTSRAIEWIRASAPQVLFVHLPDVDTSGHEFGWGSREQLLAIGDADRCVARLVEALRSRGVLDSTFILITADHGGAGTSHGADDVRSRMIPWIASGPHVRAGVDLTIDRDLTIHTEDSFATLSYVLGITPTKPVDGKPILGAFAGR